MFTETAKTEDPDKLLFMEAVKGTTPLANHERALIEPAPHPPVPVQRILDEHAALQESLRDEPLDCEESLETGEELVYLRDGLPRQTLRKLRRGHWVAQGYLDLHGMNRVEARESLSRFLTGAQRSGRRCVRIIHGKGLGSKNREPVLKTKVKIWLARRDDVLAFCQAPDKQGGGGALLDLLKA